MKKTVVVTGSSGYIGGQTVLALKEAGYVVAGIDVRQTPAHLAKELNHVCVADFASDGALEFILMHNPCAIVHCAGTSLVGPSVTNPQLYYQNNFVKTKILLDTLVVNNRQDIKVIFSSSASVYGDPVMIPCNEEDPPLPMSPYGESKLMVEMLLQSYSRAYGIHPVIFRYFNACGADPQGRHGQDNGATHIFARVLESIRDNKTFILNGNNYATRDGTCVRDYIHVSDIANAHTIAIDDKIPAGVYNLGSNQGTSNNEIIEAAERITGKKLNMELGGQRAGDPPALTASADKFNKVAGDWKRYNLDEMIQHAWNWYV